VGLLLFIDGRQEGQSTPHFAPASLLLLLLLLLLLHVKHLLPLM
jgi:hypothetical protein